MKFKKRGVDLSKWNKAINFLSLKKEGINFVILRLGYTTNDGRHVIDPFFDYFYKTAKKLHFNIGAYWYGLPEDIGKENELSDYITTVLSGFPLDMPFYYDIEGRLLKEKKDRLTEHIIKLGEHMEENGFFYGIYMSLSAFNNAVYDDRLKRFTHWVAAWRKTTPTLKSGAAVDLWQYGGETNLLNSRSIDGIIVDQNFLYRDFPTLIKDLHKNGC